MKACSTSFIMLRPVLSNIASCISSSFKLDFTAAEKEAFFYQVNQALLGAHGEDVQFIGVNFLESLVSEFSPSTSSAMGLPREFHKLCRTSLELNYLKTFYCWALDAALSVTNKIIESDAAIPEVKVCTAAVRLMLQILNWEFWHDANSTKAGINIFSAGVRHGSASASRSECVLVQLGPAWCDDFISSGHVEWLRGLYAALRQKFSREGYWLDCPIAVSAQKLIVLFCSLTGTIFPSDTYNGKMQENHLLQLLSGRLQWIDPPDAVSKAIEEGKSERPFGTLTLLSTLMCEVVKVLMTNNTDEETWSWVARDILLDTWTIVLVPLDGNGGDASLPPEGKHAAANLVAMILESELKVKVIFFCLDDIVASASVANDGGDSDYLQASISGWGIIDPTETLEELYSLLLITGHVLADEGDGETPLYINYFCQIDCPCRIAQHLWSLIIRFAEQSMDPEVRATVFSPQLMEAVIWFLARWSHTYLMPLEEASCHLSHDYEHQHQSIHSRKALLSFFGEHNQGQIVLNIIVHISMMALISYPGEKDLHGLTCHHLLHTLVHRKNICHQLVSLVVALLPSLDPLYIPRARPLDVRTITGSDPCSLSFWTEKFRGLKSVSCLLERLHGAATAAEPRTQAAIYEMGISVMNPVLLLLEVYKHEISVSLSSTLLSEAKTEKYKDLHALLQLLSSLCSKVLVDFSSDSVEVAGTNISQVVYFGLHIVTPLVSLELLKYPKLCHDYFLLLLHILEVYPETLAQLNIEAFAHILGTLDFGLHHQVNCYPCKTGLGSHAAGQGNLSEGIFSRFLLLLLQLLLFEDYSPDLVSAAADALLPLLLCEQDLYQRLDNELIERQAQGWKTRCILSQVQTISLQL
ncbi:hypothetical protein CRYUN_Cryun09bG0200800 [Craigia yunnanensis]